MAQTPRTEEESQGGEPAIPQRGHGRMTSSYQPRVLVDATNLSREDWLAFRRQGIGGSDTAALLGISPWRTARDLYYDKLGVAAASLDTEDNWVQLEVGTLLEPLVAKIFQKRTGLKNLQAQSHVQPSAVSVDVGRSRLPRGDAGRRHRDS